MPKYKPIPVSVAKQISEDYDKSQVVVLTHDPLHNLTHTTTYGVNAFDKENAAAAGVICAKAVGSDLSQAKVFEDFHRDYNPAVQKAALELLQKLIARNDGSPWAIQQMEELLKQTGWRLRHG